MRNLRSLPHLSFALTIVLGFSAVGVAQRSLGNTSMDDNSSFGPVMQAYLGYLANEQEVVDDRISRREISAAYYHRNSNRIRALLTNYGRCLKNPQILGLYIQTLYSRINSSSWRLFIREKPFTFSRGSIPMNRQNS